MTSTNMAILPPPTLIQQILDLISTSANLLTLLIAVILFWIVIYRFISMNSFHRKQNFQDLAIYLSMNTHGLLILRNVLQFVFIDLNTIKRNFFSVKEFHDSFLCRLKGYIILSLYTTLYWSYTIQALYRCARVVFPTNASFYESRRFICILLCIEVLFGFVALIPIMVGFNAIYLLPNEPYCISSYTEPATLGYIPIFAFILPLSTIALCYLCIVWKIRRLTTIPDSERQRNRYDFIIIRRMILLIIVISIVSLPLAIDLIIYIPQGHIDPSMNLIGWVSSSINGIALVISLPFINPKLYKLVKTRSNKTHNQICG